MPPIKKLCETCTKKFKPEANEFSGIGFKFFRQFACKKCRDIYKEEIHAALIRAQERCEGG